MSSFTALGWVKSSKFDADAHFAAIMTTRRGFTEAGPVNRAPAASLRDYSRQTTVHTHEWFAVPCRED